MGPGACWSETETVFEGQVSSKMTDIFNWPVQSGIFFSKLLVIYFIKDYHSKVKFKAKNVLIYYYFY